MRWLVLIPLLGVPWLQAEASEPPAGTSPPSFENVNSKYRVESVQIADPIRKKVSRRLREEAESLVGQYFDPKAVADLARRIREQVHFKVTHRVEKGGQPEYVKVLFEGQPRRWDEDDAKVTKLAYHQKQGWTGGLELGGDLGQNRFEFGLQSDGDRLIERYSGLNAGFSRPLGTDRVRVRFEFDALHQQWDPATQVAMMTQSDVPGIYRERFSMEPEIVILLAPGLSLSTGVSFQHFQTQFPAARFEAANAVGTTLRQQRHWGGSGSTAGHELDAGYSLRAATNLLDSDFVYVKHTGDVRYSVRSGRSTVILRAQGGTMSGRAPLFERYALGNTRTLRGWNKFDVDPLGGSRVAYASVEYRYRFICTYYDTGAVWDRNEDPDQKHAVGLVLALGRNGPFLTVGFPVRGESVYPIFMMAMNF
jgi:hypothetical protein